MGIIYNEELHTTHPSQNIVTVVKERITDGVICTTNRINEKYVQNFRP